VRKTASELLRAFALHCGLLCGLALLLLLIVVIADIRASILGSSVVPPLVKMLENHDDLVRSTAARLLEEFALHGLLHFILVQLLLLIMVIDDVRASTFKSNTEFAIDGS
jgi:hypothetical protein